MSDDQYDAARLVSALLVSPQYACELGLISRGTLNLILNNRDLFESFPSSPMKRLIDVSDPPLKIQEDQFMRLRKKTKNTGPQQLFPEVTRAVEEHYQSRPRGMPCLEVITTELARLGYPAADAEYVYDRWLANGFKIGSQPIKSWRPALRNWIRNGWLPTQKGVRPTDGLEIYPTYDRVQAWCERKKVTALATRAWGELMTGRFRGKAITNQLDFNGAMEVIRAQWMKEP